MDPQARVVGDRLAEVGRHGIRTAEHGDESVPTLEHLRRSAHSRSCRARRVDAGDRRRGAVEATRRGTFVDRLADAARHREGQPDGVGGAASVPEQQRRGDRRAGVPGDRRPVDPGDAGRGDHVGDGRGHVVARRRGTGHLDARRGCHRRDPEDDRPHHRAPGG